MKQINFSLLLMIFVSSLLHGQQVTTQKIPYVPKEPAIFHTAVVSALNTKTGQSLVVWEKITTDNHTIWGRLLNSKGKPISGQILLADPPATRPTVVYNAVRNEFLIAYDDNPDLRQTHTDVYIRKLNALGRPIAAATKVTTDTISTGMANFLAKLSYNPRNGNYGIVWIREVLTQAQVALGNNGLVGTVLNGTGPIPGSISVIARTVIDSTISSPFLWPIPLATAYHPTNGKVLVGFVQTLSGTGGNQANYTLGTLDGNFANITASNFGTINPTVLVLSNQFSWALTMAFQDNGNGVIFFVDSANLRRRKINTLGKLSGPPAIAFRPPKNNTKLFFPTVAFVNGPSGLRGLLIAVQGAFSTTGASEVWGQFLNATGVGIGAPIKFDTTIASETALATTLVAIPQPATSTTYRFAAFYVQGAFTFVDPNQTFVNSGILELNLNATLP